MSLRIQFRAKTNFNIKVYAGGNQGIYKSVFKNRRKRSRRFPNHSTGQGVPKIGKRKLGYKTKNNFPRTFRKWSRMPGVSQPGVAEKQLVPLNNGTAAQSQYNHHYWDDLRTGTQSLSFRIKLPRGVDPSNLLQLVQYRAKFEGSGWSDSAQLSSLIPNNPNTMDDDEEIPWNDVSPQYIDFSQNDVAPQYIDFSQDDIAPQYIDFSQDDEEITWNDDSPQFNDLRALLPASDLLHRIPPSRSNNGYDERVLPESDLRHLLNQLPRNDEGHYERVVTKSDLQPFLNWLSRSDEGHYKRVLPESDLRHRVNQLSRCDEGYYEQEFGSSQHLDNLSDDIVRNEFSNSVQPLRERLSKCLKRIEYYENMLQSIMREIQCREEMISNSNLQHQTPVFRGVYLAGDDHMLQLAVEVANNVFTGSVPEWGLCAKGQTIRGLTYKLQESSHIGNVCCVMVGSVNVLHLAEAPQSLEISMIEIIEQYCVLIASLKRNFQQIIWLNLLPIPSLESCLNGRARFRYQEAIDEINKFLFTLNDGETVLVLDVNKCFIDQRGISKTQFFCRTMDEGRETSLGGVRLNHEGMSRLIEAIETCLFLCSTV